MSANNNNGLLLRGLDGSNPLGFLAAVGTLKVLNDCLEESVRLGWHVFDGAWRPTLTGLNDEEEEFCRRVCKILKDFPMTVFAIGKEDRKTKNKQGEEQIREANKFPFVNSVFIRELKKWQADSSLHCRREVDLLASFGTYIYPDNKTDEFQETKFRMVRSGDADRQGMLSYARKIRENISVEHIKRTLFSDWDYQDTGRGTSLRWNPLEDQSYALRWDDPSKSDSRTMHGANCLATEGLACFATFSTGKQTAVVSNLGFQAVREFLR